MCLEATKGIKWTPQDTSQQGSEKSAFWRTNFSSVSNSLCFQWRITDLNTLPKRRVFRFSKVRETNPTRAAEVPIIEASETDLLAIAKQSLGSSRQAVERLTNSIPLADQFVLEILGPILSGLRDAERRIGDLS